MHFLAGCLVTYILADVTGKIIAADSVGRSTYIKFGLGGDKPPVFASLKKQGE